LLEVIRILQLGSSDWSKQYELPNYIDFSYAEHFVEAPRSPYDIVFVARKLLGREMNELMKATKAHTLFVTEDIELDKDLAYLFDCKKGRRIAYADLAAFFAHEARNYFSKPYGEKFRFNNLSIAQGFLGIVSWNGNYSVELEGEYGNTFEQIAFWRNNIPVFEGQAIDLWLEYKKDPEVEVALKVTQFQRGAISNVQQEWFFTEEELKDIVVIDNQMLTGPIFVSLMAKGKGKLEIIALHDRYSRRGHGMFLPGGQRIVTSDREEVFYYFDPGDMKPPLNVYFSGYKTMQGFEGYYMMRKMGAPFLLIAEPRLEGGSFYMGSEEYESNISSIIKKHLDELGFSNNQLILSGLSMGTYGALYYGCELRPHAMILGKPLASIGDVAANERLHRPGGFPTSLDVVHGIAGNTDEKSIQKMNDKFWDKFRSADFTQSKFVVAYMIEDDYDCTAYDKMISNIKSSGVQVYGKGIHGRHNDATGPIASWFKSQYEQILEKDFSRRVE